MKDSKPVLYELLNLMFNRSISNSVKLTARCHTFVSCLYIVLGSCFHFCLFPNISWLFLHVTMREGPLVCAYFTISSSRRRFDWLSCSFTKRHINIDNSQCHDLASSYKVSSNFVQRLYFISEVIFKLKEEPLAIFISPRQAVQG